MEESTSCSQPAGSLFSHCRPQRCSQHLVTRIPRQLVHAAHSVHLFKGTRIANGSGASRTLAATPTLHSQNMLAQSAP